MSLQQWDLRLTINISFNGCEWKKYVEKRWQKMKSWRRKETNKNISARSLTLWSGGVGIFYRPQPEPESVMPLMSLSLLKCFNPLKSILCQPVRKHLQKVVRFIRFVYSRAFNKNVISNGKFYCCNDTFTDHLLAKCQDNANGHRKIICLSIKYFWMYFVTNFSTADATLARIKGQALWTL